MYEEWVAVLGGREHALSVLAQVCSSRGMERAVFVLMVKGVFIRKNKLKSRRARQ